VLALDQSVPVEVGQLFETAKNLSLYSWFVYRFHQVSELIAFSALEMALRRRYSIENPDSLSRGRPPTLYGLLQHAKKEQWITNEGFTSLYEGAKNLAAHKKSMDLISAHDFEKEPTVLVEELSDEEIKAVLLDMDTVEGILFFVPRMRNELAHGSSNLHPYSISTLITVSETINQVFQDK
jgi:hypothetical protein